MKYYLALRRNKSSSRERSGGIKSILLNERSSSFKNYTFYDFKLYVKFWKWQNYGGSEEERSAGVRVGVGRGGGPGIFRTVKAFCRTE